MFFSYSNVHENVNSESAYSVLFSLQFSLTYLLTYLLCMYNARKSALHWKTSCPLAAPLILWMLVF